MEKAPRDAEFGSPERLVAKVRGLTLGQLARIPDTKISVEKQSTSWRTKWDSNSRSGQEILPLKFR